MGGKEGKEGPVLLLEFTVQKRQQHKYISNQNTQRAAGRATRLPRSAERKDAELGRNRTGGAAGGHSRGEFQSVQMKDHAGPRALGRVGLTGELHCERGHPW